MGRLAAIVAMGAAAATATAPQAEAKCARMGLKPAVLTSSVSVPADGGGIVVGTQIASWDEDDQGEALQPTWGFLTGRDLAQAVTTVIAPGLVVYSVPAGTPTTGELTDGTRVLARLTTTTRKVARLPAPKIKELRHAVREGRRRSESVLAVLAGDAPADAIALVVFDAKTRRARSWGVAGGDPAIAVYSARSCLAQPTGTIGSRRGDRVTLAWLDRHGRLSPHTRAVVTSQPNAK